MISFKKSFSLLMLTSMMAVSVNANTFLNGVKYGSVWGGTYTAADSLCTKFSTFTDDTNATIAATAATTAVAAVKEYEERVKLEEAGKLGEFNHARAFKNVFVEGVKPSLVLAALQLGMPALNWMFTNFIKVDKMVTKVNITARDAQKLIAAYITLAKVVGLIQEVKKSDRRAAPGA